MTRKRTAQTYNAWRLMPVIIFLSVASVYLATLTRDYYWDGITFALQIEKVASDDASPAFLFHQNHLLYNPLNYALYSAVKALGINLRALHLLQIVNAIVGACAVAVLYRVVEVKTSDRYTATVSAIALAASAAWWKLSTDADAYILSVFLILVFVKNLTGPRPRWYVAGGALAGAMLIHQLAAVFFPAALLAVVYADRIRHRRRFAIAMAASAWGATLAVYYACAALFHGITGPLQVVKWAVSNQTGVSASLDLRQGILLAPRANFDLIFGHRLDLIGRTPGLFTIVAATLIILASMALVYRMLRGGRIFHFIKSLRGIFGKDVASDRQAVSLVVAWAGGYLLFLLFWEPWQVYYRVFYAPALALALAVLLDRFYRSTGQTWRGATALAVAALAPFNLAFYVAPNMRADSNLLVASALNARQVWDESTVILHSSRNEADTAFEYFNPQARWDNFQNPSPTYLDSLIRRAYNQGGSLWLNKGAAESLSPEWVRARATGRQVSVDAPGAPALYTELKPPAE